ncbi:Endo-1,4-beta-xylanase A precursor [Paenibacillus konkukensis]|uniref:Endo-1,4-beta-xylanase A n=1 Tax=Paenibacillus konkukensis TaxID=2020716 RepID=A0ABY4RSP1_9BACL|nr:S-layer homology domain-containing protein [Paenibacillus konkukensis]UQZ84412.1 Endo-1,4-beta-xylanase A precursor [Paenibacillus konkukensis]
MKRLTYKWTSLSIVLALLISLVAPITAFAEVTLSISNLQYRNTQEPPGANAAVDQFTTNPITVIADVNGISDEEMSNIYFEVTNMSTGKSFVDKTSKPVKSGNNQITFTNVNLTEGLNKIVLRFDGTVNTASAPSWAYYIPVSTISNLYMNGDSIVDGQMYPKKAPYTGATITGAAGNATSIEAYLNGGATSYIPANFTRGTFTYITNTGRVNDIKFVPGDNDVTFVSKNSTNTYNLVKSFIYDDGKAFAYNSYIDSKSTPSAAPTKKLSASQHPTLEKSSTVGNNVTFSTSLKTTRTSGVSDYVYADIEMVGTGGVYKLRYNFNDKKMAFVDPSNPGVLNENETPTFVPALNTVNANVTVDSSGAYEVHNIQLDLPINKSRRFQQIDVTFVHKNLIDTTKSSFTFNFVDQDAAYVDKVERIIPNVTPSPVLNETGNTQITEFPATLRVTAVNASQVLVKLNGNAYDDGSHSGGIYPLTAGTTGTADIILQGIRDGASTLEVIPYDAAYESVPAGAKSYDLIISAAPYIIVDNIFDGMVVKSATEITCADQGGPCISGRVVNLGSGEMTVSINNKVVTNSATASPITLDPATGRFTVKVDAVSYFGTDDGRKPVHFEIFINNQKVTEANYDIFVFSNFLPTIVSFAPDYDPKDVRFSKDTRPDTYYTTANQMKISGSAANASLSVTYLKPGSTSPATVNISPVVAGATTTVFRSVDSISLNDFGTYTFTVTGTNSSGATVSKSFSITREPTPYQILVPTLIKNEDGKDQANINKNFQKITILAENADSVLFGKEEAVKETDPNQPGIYYYEATGLKPGKNEIKFTVNRSSGKLSGSFILYNVDTPIEGNQYKAKLASSFKVFNGDLVLTFPKDTKLMRNDRTAEKQYISADRKILFGIASNDDGRVDKELEDRSGKNFLVETTGRFKPASKRFWIDGGTIEEISAPNEDLKLKDALEGSGRLPNEASQYSSSNDTFYNRYIKDMVVPTKRGSLTLKYDPNIRDDAWKYITVFQFNTFADNNGDPNVARPEWRNIGGVIDLKSNSITVPFDSFGYYQVMYMDDSFDDVTNHSWARDFLDTLYSKGIMTNKETSPTKFLPDESITRGEFVTMLVKIFNIPLENEDTNIIDSTDPKYDGTFKDVQRGNYLTDSAGLYDFKHIEAAARAGIVRGNSDGYFGHHDAITRQDAAVMIARAADLKMNSNDTAVLASLQKSFTDAASIDYYARSAVEAATKQGFIEGMPNVLLEGQKKQTLRFAPKDYFSRAEAAAVAIRVLKQQKKIPK